MADMELVVKIPEEAYKLLKNDEGVDWLGAEHILNAVANGTPLPKGHGDLIDADALIDTLGCSDRDEYTRACIEEDAPILIEADRSV